MINDYRSRSGVSWDYERNGFWSTESKDLTQFRDHLSSLQPRVRYNFGSSYIHFTHIYYRKKVSSGPLITRNGQFFQSWTKSCQGRPQPVGLLMTVPQMRKKVTVMIPAILTAMNLHRLELQSMVRRSLFFHHPLSLRL